jgi:hypothetical protein
MLSLQLFQPQMLFYSLTLQLLLPTPLFFLLMLSQTLRLLSLSLFFGSVL